MFSHISCYPCGAVILWKKVICSKCLHRSVRVSVDYMLGEIYISYGITHKHTCRMLFLVVEHNI